jgi:hypothetical protein
VLLHNTLGKGGRRPPVASPHLPQGGNAGTVRPGTPTRVWHPRPASRVAPAMITPPDLTAADHVSSGEAAPASQTPAVIELPYLPPAIESDATTSRKGRRGRHHGPRPAVDPRSAWLTTRTTPEFLAKVRADAKAAGMPLSDYMHLALSGRSSPRARRIPSETTKILAQIVGQMGKRGSNLNQAARALNEINLASQDGEGRDGLADRIEEMMELHRQAIAEHRECVAEIMRALGLRPDADHY